MRILLSLVLLLALMIFGQKSYAQAQHNDHDHGHEGKKNEIGGALGVVYNLTEKYTASGFHVHYSRTFGKKLQFGISPGLEFIVGEDKHYTFHCLALYRPVHGWWMSIGPGITYFEHDYSYGFSGHIESGYEFDAGAIHFGPVFEYSWAETDQHLMLGIHLGVPF